jgi:hypothetical protein
LISRRASGGRGAIIPSSFSSRDVSADGLVLGEIAALRRDFKRPVEREKGCMVQSGEEMVCRWMGPREQQDIVKADLELMVGGASKSQPS